MFLSFLLGLAAGYLEPIAKPHVQKAIEDVFDIQIPQGRSEYDMVTLLFLMLMASLLASLLSVSMTVPLLVGTFLALFGKRFYIALTEVHIRPGPRDDN
ncbi:hypothetical protein [Nioella aestuarii]|uniref:hypothetical protein n=1 Tax=Nioella aestuarii TaxID=1662864 RepID=UPI003D7FB2DF